MARRHIGGVVVAVAAALATAGCGAAGLIGTGDVAGQHAQRAIQTPTRVPERDADGTILVRLGDIAQPVSALTVDGSLLGEVVVVPGDSGGSSIRVRNDGPTDGLLTASIVNAAAFRDPGNSDWIDDSFYDDLTINGIAASDLEGYRTVIKAVELAQGQSVDIPISYAFDGWSGNRTGGGLRPDGVIVNPDGVGERSFSFDVDLRIVGDSDEGTDIKQTDTDTSRDASGRVIDTGGAALPPDKAWLLLVAAALTALAGIGTRILRRRSAQSGSAETPE